MRDGVAGFLKPADDFLGINLIKTVLHLGDVLHQDELGTNGLCVVQKCFHQGIVLAVQIALFPWDVLGESLTRWTAGQKLQVSRFQAQF